jgi:hypothetical protein
MGKIWMESIKKTNQTKILEIKISLSQINIVEIYSSRQEKLEDRFSGLKNKIDIKEQNSKIIRQKI